MKKIFIISKTHLDLGFTGYAEDIKRKYLTEYIPSAIKLGRNLNKNGNKNFVWTTGSWILKEALHSDDEKLKSSLIDAIKRGDIAAHALPFTTHTELLDEDLFEYGLSIVDEIDKISGRKTIAAKMTDVPGHTCAIVPNLAKHGIKLLHIGVNGASPLPNVPECFLWKFGGAEIVVIYSGEYGGLCKCEGIDDMLYFDHTLDNRGTKSESAVMHTVQNLQRKYPDYEVCAGTLDDVAESLWNIKDKLPVVEAEIGDTWIHGVATDPYKTAAFRKLCSLKNQWLADGSMTKDSEEYVGFADNLLCVAEHTWGLDIKVHFADMENYLKKDFTKARARDIVRLRHPFVYFPNSFTSYFSQMFTKKRTYSDTQKGWEEQREYINLAMSYLSEKHLQEAKASLKTLRPTRFDMPKGQKYMSGQIVEVGDSKFCVFSNGGVKLEVGGNVILDSGDKPIVEYRSYGTKDYDYWLNNYTRDLKSTRCWAVGDFARPGLKRVDKKFPQGVFGYTLSEAIFECQKDEAKVIAKLDCPQYLKDELGAPKQIFVQYLLKNDDLAINLIWLDKDAIRTTESIALRLYPTVADNLTYIKMGAKINPQNIVANGGRKLLVAEAAEFICGDMVCTAHCEEAPLMATDGGNILHFDNCLASDSSLTYVLYDNVWGTNFPLWYDENAQFNVKISVKK